MTTNNGMPDISADLKALRDDIGQLMKQVVDKNKDKLMHAKDEVLGKAGAYVETAEKNIQSRPFLAVLIAFILGLFFGAIAKKA